MDKSRRIFLHLAVWLALIVTLMYINTGGNVTHATVVFYIYYGIVNVSLFYINYLFILPNFLDKKRYLLAGLAMVFLMLLFVFIKCGMAYYFYDIIMRRVTSTQETHILNFWDYFMFAVMVSCFFIFLSTILKFIIDWFRNEKIKSNLENEKLISELAFLKSQINPHFLFNSLNNIYSLAYQRSEKTPEAVLKLSEIMRYMLYESNENQVKLDDEIRYLQNYIELQKLRFKDQAYIKFQIDGNTESQKITPLVLISFVENAFKHGIATDEQNPITIVLSVSSGKLYFHVLNKKSHQNKDDTGGIGLHNVKRRLDLLYKEKYRLHIEDTEKRYSCELYLDL